MTKKELEKKLKLLNLEIRCLKAEVEVFKLKDELREAKQTHPLQPYFSPHSLIPNGDQRINTYVSGDTDMPTTVELISHKH